MENKTPDKKKFAKGQCYVALNRMKFPEGMTLCDIDSNKFLNHPHDDRDYPKYQGWCLWS